jgi:hypothetical protein
MKRHLASTLMVCVLAAGCAGGVSTLQPGATAADVERALGAPTARYALPAGGARLEHARGPMGKQTWMVDLDAQGRVIQWFQALTEARLTAFMGVAPGLSRDELLRTLGRPGEIGHGGVVGGQLWSWRYETNECLWFQALIGNDAKVVSAGFGIDWRCDAGDRARP